jgi:hypothetical protein
LASKVTKIENCRRGPVKILHLFTMAKKFKENRKKAQELKESRKSK